MKLHEQNRILLLLYFYSPTLLDTAYYCVGSEFGTDFGAISQVFVIQSNWYRYRPTYIWSLTEDLASKVAPNILLLVELSHGL